MVDKRNRITLNVTRELIAEGVATYRGCPIALAAIAAGIDSPSVEGRIMTYWANGGWREAKLSIRATIFASRFDTASEKRRGRMRPFRMRLNLA